MKVNYSVKTRNMQQNKGHQVSARLVSTENIMVEKKKSAEEIDHIVNSVKTNVQITKLK